MLVANEPCCGQRAQPPGSQGLPPAQHLALSCEHWAAAGLRKWRGSGLAQPLPSPRHGSGPTHHTAWGGALTTPLSPTPGHGPWGPPARLWRGPSAVAEGSARRVSTCPPLAAGCRLLCRLSGLSGGFLEPGPTPPRQSWVAAAATAQGTLLQPCGSSPSPAGRAPHVGKRRRARPRHRHVLFLGT